MELQTKRFTKNDSGFVCAHCGKNVPPMGSSSRNHCPYCLWSLHVDILPGDRQNECRGQMEPIGAVTDPRKGYIIIHKCQKCGKIGRNKAAYGCSGQQDDLNLLIGLTAKHF